MKKTLKKIKNKLTKKDIKVVSHEEAYWTKVIQETELNVTNFENGLKFNRFVLRNAREELKAVKEAEKKSPFK